MNFCRWILKLFGWKVDITLPDYPKCIICVAPHTSNWDFIIGKLAYASVGRKAGFLMKETWFFFPLGILFRAIGGVPVPRGRSRDSRGSLVEYLVERFRSSDHLVLAITPEGTRSRTSRWHTGFLRIAAEAGVPVALGVLDFRNRRVIIRDRLELTGDIEADLRRVKEYYRGYEGRYPDKFTTD
ncbi:MAG: 1-acyl-sn-glycerol-3-phosphate acyltransferase [Clostridium sp.]|nr:1-acyl-sn-glycerol-3-phosphate acyltransferase [Clostridium sp.]